MRTTVDHLEIAANTTQKENGLKTVYKEVGLSNVCSFPLGECTAYFLNRAKTLKLK